MVGVQLSEVTGISTVERLNCDELKAMIPAYVVNALDPEELKAFRASIRECPELMEELRAYNATANWLLENVPAQVPPPSLKQAILARASEQHGARPATARKHKQTAPITPVAVPVVRAAWLQWVAALLAVLLIGSNLVWFFASNLLPGERSPSTSPTVDQRSGFGEVSRVELVSTTPDETPNGALSWVRTAQDEQWVAWFSGNNLPLYAEDAIYELWAVDANEEAQLVGRFLVDETGTGAVVFEINVPLGSFARFVVAQEAAGAAETGEAVLVTDL